MKHAQSSCESGQCISHGERLETQPTVGPIVMACDESYAMQLAIALRSAVESNRSPQPLDVYILWDQFSENMREKVLDSLPVGSAVIHWVPVDLGLFAGFPTLPHISSKMTFARFMIPRVFPEDVKRVLYLDADLVVLDDLSPLWNTDLKGGVIGAVLDRILDPKLKARVPGVDKWLDRFPSVRDYFNAGVLLIDLDTWRKQRVSENALEYLTRFPDVPFADQDALNVACDGRWTQLDIHWNFYDHFTTAILEMPLGRRPKIAHFSGSLKPWNASALSVNADFYDAFRRRTRFSRTTTDKVRDLGSAACSRTKRLLKRTSFGQAVRSRYIRSKSEFGS